MNFFSNCKDFFFQDSRNKLLHDSAFDGTPTFVNVILDDVKVPLVNSVFVNTHYYERL